MPEIILNYEDWLKTQEKYDGSRSCFVYDCDRPALYEGGDARYYCGMCEEHASMEGRYRSYLASFHIYIKEKESAFEAYLRVRNRRNKLQKKIEEALKEDGPELSET